MIEGASLVILNCLYFHCNIEKQSEKYCFFDSTSFNLIVKIYCTCQFQGSCYWSGSSSTTHFSPNKLDALQYPHYSHPSYQSGCSISTDLKQQSKLLFRCLKSFAWLKLVFMSPQFIMNKLDYIGIAYLTILPVFA